MSRKKYTVEDVEAWWKTASYADKVELIDALVAKIGKEEAYLIMVGAVGGEEALEALRVEVERRSRLS